MLWQGQGRQKGYLLSWGDSAGIGIGQDDVPSCQ